MDLSERLEFTKALAKSAGELLRQRREGGELQEELKGGIELVTDADVDAEVLIKDALMANFPDDSILAEETAERPTSKAMHGAVWVIDPIDGTVNFARGHPNVAVSIAWYNDGVGELGVVYNPFLDELFYASRGGGAWLNDKQIHVSGNSDVARCVVATGFPYCKSTRAELVARLGRVLKICGDVRRIGSAALDICWVACGRLDAYYESVCPWDHAAARILAREAGARLGRTAPLEESDLPEELNGRHLLIATPGVYDALHAAITDE